MSVKSALTFEQATTLHNTHPASRSCAFAGVLSCAQRQRLLLDQGESSKKKELHKGQRAEQIVNSFKADVPTGVVLNDQGKLVGADPYAFADYLFESVSNTSLSDATIVNIALKMAENQIGVFPYLPLTRKGHCVVYSKTGLVKEFHDKYQLPEEEQAWHSQCIVGASVDSRTQERYFVCVQSWPHCVLTFVPAMSTKEIIRFSRLPANKKNTKMLSIPTAKELDLARCCEVLFPWRLKDKHAPSQARFAANEKSGMLLPSMHSGYLPKGMFAAEPAG